MPTNGHDDFVERVSDVVPTSLVDESEPPEEVNDEIGFSFIQVNEDIDKEKDDEGEEEVEWDDRMK